MKRFFLGVTLLTSVVGMGAVGAFFGHDLLSQATQPKADPKPKPVATTRDLTPTPIPLAETEPEPVPGPANPFAGQTLPLQTPTTDRHVDNSAVDRYGEPFGEASADMQPAKDYAADQLGAEVTESDIPPADQLDAANERLAAMPADAAEAPRPLPPVDSRYADPADRYAEQTVSAEEPQEPFDPSAPADDPTMPADDPAAPVDDPAAYEEAAEPAALAPAPARGSFDRYGRPLPQTETPEPAAAPAEEPFPSADQMQANTVAPADQVAPAAQDPFAQSAPAALEPIGTAAAAGAATAAMIEGTGRPGDPRLSGAQAPTITIEKTAPPEIQIGKPAKFLIKVRNTGAVTAHGVEIHDTIPQGTQLSSAMPEPTRGPAGELVWALGSLKPGNEQTIELELMPTEEGEVGSVATVQFHAEASVRSTVTKPMLEMEVAAPDSVMKGQPVALRIKLSNPGSGAATGVVLSESVPKQLSHPAGAELEFDVGTLEPGQSRELELKLAAVEAGRFVNVMTARGDANLNTEVQTAVEVVAPALKVDMRGPKVRYLERNATHNISVSNPGTATAKDIELVAVLPRELKFVSANNNGQFDAATHSVYWSLAELPPQETGTVTLTTLPLQAGDAKLLIKSRAQQDLSDEEEEVVAIEGLAAISFQLHDASDPIEVEGKTTYEIRVTNQGTKAAGNVQLVALLPTEMKAVSADGPVRHHVEGQRVVFEPLKQLGPKADTTYHVTVQALQPGDLRLQVQLATNEIREPITKEESTRVYGKE